MAACTRILEFTVLGNSVSSNRPTTVEALLTV